MLKATEELKGDIYAASDIGLKRKNNEDIAYCAKSQFGILLCVADGMGGYRRGEVASKIAIDSFSVPFSMSKSSYSVRKARHFLIRHAREANEEIYQMSVSDESYQNMGTTISSAFVAANGTEIFSVGDSRVYAFSKEKGLTQITKDQSYVQMLFETGRINRMEMKTHPQRNILTNAIGLNSTLTNYETFTIENDSYDSLLLCTDGLYNMISDDQIKKILSSEGTAEEKSKRLISAALEQGGVDNIAVVIMEK